MTSELEGIREKIQQILLQYMSAIHAELIHSHDDVFLTDKILSYLAEKGVCLKTSKGLMSLKDLFAVTG